MRKPRAWVALSVLALAATGCRESPSAALGDTTRASARDAMPVRVVATGRIEGWREADVGAKLSGRIASYALEEGESVEAGAPVVILEHLDLEARVRRVAAEAREARLALARVRTLRAEGIVSPSERDRAEALATARAAAHDEARALLGYATVRAPFTGTVLRTFKEMGEAVTAGPPPDPLFRIADLSRLKVTAEVPENDISGVHRAQAARVVAEAYPDQPFGATVTRVGMAVGRKRLRSDDPRSRIDEKVIEVELELAADERLRSGMTVTVAFDGAVTPRAADRMPPPRRDAKSLRPPH